jgi:imidazolonepropionase-like amidohydrolase
MRKIPFLILIAALVSAAHGQDVLIENVTVLSSHQSAPLPNADVLIRDGRIAEISASRLSASAATRRLDGRGKFLTPGLMDSHVHVSDASGVPSDALDPTEPAASLRALHFRQQPRSYLYFGVTQVVDLNNTARGIATFEAQPLHPDLFRCGGAPVVGGYPLMFQGKSISYADAPNYLFEPANHSAHPIPAGDDPAAHAPEAVVKRIADSGAICVKVFIEDGFGAAGGFPILSNESLQRVRTAAHARGLLLLAHANAIDMQRIAAANDVDVIVHGLWHWLDANSHPGVPEVIAAHLRELHKRKIGYQPTFRVLPADAALFEPDTLNDPVYAKLVPAPLLAWYRTEEAQFYKKMLKSYVPPQMPEAQFAVGLQAPLQRNMRATKYLHDLGHPLLLGSDTPSAPTYGAQPGYNTYLEMQLMARAGIPLADIFAAGTINNARQFRIDRDYGTVERGKLANLLLLEANPLQTVDAWGRIDKVILRGKVIERASLEAAHLP